MFKRGQAWQPRVVNRLVARQTSTLNAAVLSSRRVPGPQSNVLVAKPFTAGRLLAAYGINRADRSDVVALVRCGAGTSRRR